MSLSVRELLEEIAFNTSLEEGAEGVRAILRSVLRSQPISVNLLACSVGIAVPVVSAVRRELEKRKLLERRGGAVLTDKGVDALNELGIKNLCSHRYDVTRSLPDPMQKLIELFKKKTFDRPEPDRTIDQSHTTPETSIRRVFYMYEHGSIEGRDILLLGDDDLTSIAIVLFADYFGIDIGSITVLDIDRRILNFIEKKCTDYQFKLNSVAHDFREDLPGSNFNSFDVFCSDPPYTVDGVKLFALRGAQALKNEPGKTAYISFPSRPSDDISSIFGALSSLGLAPQEMIPGFNRYLGAQIHAGASTMLRCNTGLDIRTEISLDLSNIYTNQRRNVN